MNSQGTSAVPVLLRRGIGRECPLPGGCASRVVLGGLLLAAFAGCFGKAQMSTTGGGSTGPGTPGLPTITPGQCSASAPGHVSIHRLTNEEYNNTVRDLLFTNSQPANAFDPVSAGASGYTNDSDHLTVYSDLIASYYAAAQSLATEVIASKGVAGGAYSKLVTCAPSAQCAQTTLNSIGARAYRRPLTSAESTALLGVFNQDSDFDTGLSDVLITLLISPKFIFTYAADPQSQTAGATFAVDPYALASRVSYFLWSSMPDDELFARASDGTLSQPNVLQAEVLRMLKDPKSSALLSILRNEWAGLGILASASGSLQGLDDTVRYAMVGEVDAFLQDIVYNDRSFLEVVTGKRSFVNQALASYYGVPFTGTSPTEFVSVSAPTATRTGVVTTAAVLTATAGDVVYTHPVHRGHWVTQRILCSEPPPPPPGIPSINPDPADGGTPRQKLAAHTSNPECSGCHAVMDTVGLGLENFDPFGQWRTDYAGPPPVVIDASGTLPDGDYFGGPYDMYAAVAADDSTRACLAQQVMSIALTRALTSADDLCSASTIAQATVNPTGTFSALVTQVVSSNQFQMQTGESP
jgi:hypothetical protein